MSFNKNVIFFYLTVGGRIPMHENMNLLLVYSETSVLYCIMFNRIYDVQHMQLISIKY